MNGAGDGGEMTALPNITSQSSLAQHSGLQKNHDRISTVDTNNGYTSIQTNTPTDASSDCNVQFDRPPFLRHIPWLFRFDKHDVPLEATGLALDMYGRGAILMSSLFLGPALLELSAEQATQQGADRVVFGTMKPSSLLSNIAIASGLLGSMVLPLFGAMVDKTPYRRQVGVCSAILLTFFKGMEVMISASTWLGVAFLQVLTGALYYIHTCACYAYTCELTRHPDQQTKYQAYYFVVLYVSTLVFLVEVLVLAYVWNTGNVGTARISQVVTFLTASVTFGVAWTYLFRNRPALSELPPTASVWRCGFVKVWETTTRIRRELPALKWFMLSVMCSESATGTLITIATTFMSHFLEMDSTEIGVVFLLVLIMGIPGSKCGERLGLVYNPVVSAKVCVLCFIGTTTAAATLITGPHHKNRTFVFGALWGVELGWLHPMHSSIFINIIPKGREESELMGMYLFCGQILSWLPPLLFTALNEAGYDMGLGLASLNVFFLLGFIFLMSMGSYEKALEAVAVRMPEDHHVDNGNDESGGLEIVESVALPPLS